jgi:hypothetical protein
MTIDAITLSPSVVAVGGTVAVAVKITEIGGYFFTSDGYALKTADGQYFNQKEEG